MDAKKKTVCLECGTTNLYPLAVLGKKVVCGRCRADLPQPGLVIAVDAEQLFLLIDKSSLPVLVDFFSPTCAPCRMMDPVVNALAARRAGEILALRINIQRVPRAAEALEVQAVPTFMVFHKGHERGRTQGAMPEADFALWVASVT